jgi:O-antigen/teichoic acid export membrane protein
MNTPLSTASLPLGNRVRSAASWAAASMLLGQTVALGRSVITARLLAPDDFGLFSMAATALVALGSLTTIGLDQAIIAHGFDREEKLRTQLDATWTAELIRKLCVTLLLMAMIYPATSFYARAELIPILAVVGLTPLIQGLQNIGLVIPRKQVEFVSLFKHELAASVAAAVVTVALAFIMRNVWALVGGHLAGVVAGTLLSYFYHPYRPRLAFDGEVFRRTLRFGKYATTIGIAAYVTTMVDNVLVGKLFGAGVLGVYAVAYNLASMPAGMIMGIAGKVSFPAYAELAAHGLERVGAAFNRSLAVSSALLTLATVPLFLLAPEIVYVLYGEKWVAAGVALRILSLVGLTRGLVVIISGLHMGVNKPRQVALGKILEAVLFLLLLYPLTSRYGAVGAAWAGVVTYLFALLNRLLSVRRLIPGAFGMTLLNISASLASGVCGAIAGTLCLSFIEGSWLRLAVGGLISTALSAALLCRLMPDLSGEVRALMPTPRR